MKKLNNRKYYRYYKHDEANESDSVAKQGRFFSQYNIIIGSYKMDMTFMEGPLFACCWVKIMWKCWIKK